MEVQFKNWVTPNFAIVKLPGRDGEGGLAAFHAGGPDGQTAFPVDVLDPEDLADLCDRFRADVFKKAGKTDPGHRAQVSREGR